MLRYIVLCLSVCLCVQSAPNKEEGPPCEWEGIKGRCVDVKRCLSSLATKSPKQPACEGKDDLICCTDCELVDSTDNAVVTLAGGLYMKDGRKARDNCLQYAKDQESWCRSDTYSEVSRRLEPAQCHAADVHAVKEASRSKFTGAKYPHQALLGYGDSQESAQWLAGGSIISDRYVLTAAHLLSQRELKLNFVAVGTVSRSDKAVWQIIKVKRTIAHPDHKAPKKYNDIGLIEIEKPISFNLNTLPACLHVENDLNITEAVATTWWDLESEDPRTFSDTLQEIQNMEQYSDKECSELMTVTRHIGKGYDKNTQMCYASKKHPTQSCRGLSGEPLLAQSQYSSCAHTIIGVTSFGYSCGHGDLKPDYFTRVSHYVPWIESVVWP